MQTLRYLAPNRIEVLANEAGHVTEYRPVYSRQLNVYRGIDNVLEFKLLNPDQKPLDVDRYTPKFVAFDENNQMVISPRNGVNLQEGDSTAYTKKGLLKVTIRVSSCSILVNTSSVGIPFLSATNSFSSSTLIAAALISLPPLLLT